MILKKAALSIFLSLFFLSVYSQEKRIELNLKNSPLVQVIQQLETDYQLLFSYKEKDIADIKVTTPTESVVLQQFLTFTLKETNLDFEISDDRFIMISQKEEDELSLTTPKTKLSGIVIDQLTETPLPFANVYLPKTRQGVATDEEGKFHLMVDCEPEDFLVISYVGYLEKKIPVTQLINQDAVTIALAINDSEEYLVLVSDYLTDGISLSAHGASTELRPEKIGTLPGQAEPDVLSTLHFLPGVSSINGAPADINIRGGTADQNLVLWEDIPLYHTAHYFGMISAFNPYIISKASIFCSGFDADYGGRVSGLIDLKSEGPELDQSKYGIGTNLINVYGNGEVSLLEDKATLVFSLRHSLPSSWRTPTFENIAQRVNQGLLLDIPGNQSIPDGINIDDKFLFIDGNLKGSYKISENDEVSLSWFYNKNDFQSFINDTNINRQQEDSLSLESTGISLSWDHRWNEVFSSKIWGISTNYHYDYEYMVNSNGGNRLDKLGLKESQIKEQQLNFVNEYLFPQKHSIKLGYQLIDYDVGYKISKLSGQNKHADEGEKERSSVHAPFISFNSSNEKKTGITAGLRGSYFQEEKQWSVAPRFRMWYRFSDALSFSLSAGKYFQFLSQIVEIDGDQSSIETPVWLLTGTRSIPILNADQLQIGGVYNKKSWLIDAQLYYKKINNLTSLSTGFGEELSAEYHIGFANIMGFDLLLKKRWKNYRSWVSYSYSQVAHEFEGFFDRQFAAPNDQPHKFHWINLLKKNQWEFSLGWKLKSGSPYSLREHFRISTSNNSGPQERIIPLVNEYNDQRLPFQHQLDASINYTFLPSGEQKWKAVFGLSIFNIYNRTNYYQRDFFIDNLPNEEPTLRYINRSDLGITPNLVVRIEW